MASQRLQPVPIRTRRKNGLVTPHAIRRLAHVIAERFRPEKIILFGSYAYGTPDPDSDVDLLVVMRAYHQSSMATQIRNSVRPQFPLDVIVRTPARLRRRLEWGDQFLQEIVRNGSVLYEKNDCRMGAKSRS